MRKRLTALLILTLLMVLPVCSCGSSDSDAAKADEPVTGWTLTEETPELYFSESLVYASNFGIKDYFWPVPNQEIFANPNTVQNYGW